MANNYVTTWCCVLTILIFAGYKTYSCAEAQQSNSEDPYLSNYTFEYTEVSLETDVKFVQKVHVTWSDVTWTLNFGSDLGWTLWGLRLGQTWIVKISFRLMLTWTWSEPYTEYCYTTDEEQLCRLSASQQRFQFYTFHLASYRRAAALSYKIVLH